MDQRKALWVRVLTNSFTIVTVLILGLGVVIANISLGRGAPPPADAADLSTNDMLALVSQDYVTPAEAAGVAAAKKRAHEAQVRAERAARVKAKREALARKRRAAERAAARARARARAAAEEAAKTILSPAQSEALGKKMNAAKGWGECWVSLDQLWTHESHWDPTASNPSSGAFGIPQALPGAKMASAGSDWETNAATQIAWGLSYISARYGTPCDAWSFWQNNNWY
jgi:hypothetical protein